MKDGVMKAYVRAIEPHVRQATAWYVSQLLIWGGGSVKVRGGKFSFYDQGGKRRSTYTVRWESP